MEGPAIVTGGAGFFGSYVVEALLKQPKCRPLISINRNPRQNLFDGVDYRRGDLADAKFVQSLISEIQPRLIFHTASPKPSADRKTLHQANVNGTRNLLDAAARTKSVKAFVFTSSVNVQAGSTHKSVTEDGPYWEPKLRFADSSTIVYWKTKAIAEKWVLAANGYNFATVSIRIPLIIGPRDNSYVPQMIGLFRSRQTGTQMGDNTNCIDTVFAANGADAHILACKALLDPSQASGNVAGEAFHITDGNPIPFWSLHQIVWKELGDKTDFKKVTIIPRWVALLLATVVEILWLVFTLGNIPPPLARHTVWFCVDEFTYDISKARERLYYRPTARTEHVLQESVAWELKQQSNQADSSKHK